ncbi:MAG: gamma-glutamyl-gamma-aminobutyrate hydrolase family protein [Candidatus Nanoarchaeia archaeon]
MILIIDLCYEKGSLSHAEFVKPVCEIAEEAGKPYVVKHYTEITGADVINAERVVLCGTALKDNGYLDHVGKLGWIKTINKPVLGICAGMQVLALLFEGKTVECREIGMKRITVKENSLFSEDLEVYCLHGLAVEGLKRFEVLARSDRCVQAIKNREKEFYGILFHPEVRQEKVVENFLLL